MVDLSLPAILFLVVVIGLAFVMRLKRKKKRYYGQTFDDVPSPYDKAEDAAHRENGNVPQLVHVNEDEKPEKLSASKRAGGVVFLSIWLSIWSVGCFFALRERLNMSYGDEGYIFMTIWLAFAVPAWFFAAWTLFRLLRGDDVEFNMDGDD